MTKTFVGSLFFNLAGITFADQVIHSPDGAISVNLSLKDGLPHWSAKVDDQTIVASSSLKIFTGGKPEKHFIFEEETIEFRVFDQSWQPTWGQFSKIRNHYHEASWKLTSATAKDTTIKVRVYNEGIALRYHVNEPTTKIGESLAFNFTHDGTLWSANGERPNLGPMKFSAWDQKPKCVCP